MRIHSPSLNLGLNVDLFTYLLHQLILDLIPGVYLGLNFVFLYLGLDLSLLLVLLCRLLNSRLGHLLWLFVLHLNTTPGIRTWPAVLRNRIILMRIHFHLNALRIQFWQS